MIVLRIARGVTDHFIRRVPEWVSAGILLKFGQALLAPSDVFPTSHAYDVMARLANEQTWGVVLVLVASMRITALTANGTFRWFQQWSPVVRASTAYLSGFVWCAVAFSLFVSNASTTGWGTYTGLLIMDVTMAVSVAREAGRAHRKYGYGSRG
jgi:hypothetical protein